MNILKDNRVAYRVECAGFTVITFAISKASARWNAVRAYRDAGYGRGNRHWPSGVSAARVEHLDIFKPSYGHPRACISEIEI